MFSPSENTVEAVKAWLIKSGIPEETISLSMNKGWIQFDASTQDVEGLLGAKYHYYEHSDSERKHIGCDEYKVPEFVAEHIDFVTPGVKFVATKAMSELKKRGLATASRLAVHRPMPDEIKAKIKQNPGKLINSQTVRFHSNMIVNTDATDHCGTTITPACIKAIYNITDGTLADSSNSMGIYEFGDVYAQQDLNQFFKTYAT
jgi:tripeptidyl-peptidase-1